MAFSKFFSIIQETPWYRAFLNPVIHEINKGKVLDIGTGSGKLLQILSIEKGIECVGTDTNSKMLKEAKIKLNNTNVTLYKTEKNEKLPFKEKSFEYITICNVLFYLDKDIIDNILINAQLLLKDNGKIIILTPSNNKNILNLIKHFFSIKNLSIFIWFFATKNKAIQWNNTNYLKQFAYDRNLNYKSKIVMNGFAILEVIS